MSKDDKSLDLLCHLAAENARLTAALAAHREFVAWHMDHGSLEGDETTPEQCQVRYSSDEIAWHDAATERLLADPTGSEAAARVQALVDALVYLSSLAGEIERCSPAQGFAEPNLTCPHGNTPTYPAHAWWCDDCFGGLQVALKRADAALACWRGTA